MGEASGSSELQQTLRRAALGDQDAWRIIVERYTPRVFGLLRAQCGQIDIAEEITQSTFCTIVAKLPDYDEVGKFESWLFRIAVNRLRDEMRRRKRHAALIEDDALTGVAEDAAGATARGGVREDIKPLEEESLAALQGAVAELPEADQRIIQLRHYAELSFKQIADVLGQPVGTVLARHHRALKKLRDLLGGEDSLL